MSEIPSHKSCSKCKESKPLDAFSFDRSNKYGRAACCKLCVNKRRKKFRENHPHKIPTDPEKYLQHRAWATLRRRIYTGRLKRGDCEMCQSPNAQAHHWKGYAEEYFIDVKWLCQKHHHLYHKIERTNQEAAASVPEDLSSFFSFAHAKRVSLSLPNRS